MALRLAVHLPRLVVLGVVFLFAGATLTYGAAKRLAATPASAAQAAAAPALIVPDVTGQAFVFAKGSIEDAGFAWRVTGAVHGYATNTVASQIPVAGTKLKDTGAPTLTLTLTRSSYGENGEPEDVSPYQGTAVVPYRLRPIVAAPAIPAAPKGREQRPAVKPAAKPVRTPAAPAERQPAFATAGAPKEPRDEIPLTLRAERLSSWVAGHGRTQAGVSHFLYQNAWIVTGAKFGWWHGAQALRQLIAADRLATRRWGIGHRSELAAQRALAEVEARSR